MVRSGLMTAAALLFTAIAGAAHAVDVRVVCYSDGNECDVLRDLGERFGKANADIRIVIDQVPYKAVLESLPVQLAAGNGPDIARVTDFGTVARYLLDLRPYLADAAAWEENFGQTLSWMRPSPDDKGIYGVMSQLTITGPYVNKSLFDQADMKLPGPQASWDDWAAAVAEVARRTGALFGMAWDRSGHRFGGPAISYGAKLFGIDGAPDVVDDGFKAMATRFIRWNRDNTVERDVWTSTGSGYRDAFEEFANGRIVLYLSGSWQLSRMQKQIGDSFEWLAVPNPCGPAACSGMPGGAAYVALKQTKNPKQVAAFLDYLASTPIHAEMMSRTINVPAHQGLQKSGIKYDLSPNAAAAMAVFAHSATQLAPLAYRYQGYRFNRVMFDATVDRISQAITGQLTLDQAYERINADIASRIAAATKQ